MNPFNILLLLLSWYTTDAYKFLVYSKLFGYSHTKFMGAIADALTEAGHDVSVVMPIIDLDQGSRTGLKLTKKITKIPIDPRVEEVMKSKGKVVENIWSMEPSLLGLLKIAGNMTASFTYQCEAVISDDMLLKKLTEEKYDVGIAEAFMICGLGLFEVLKIPASIAASSGVEMDAISKSIGESVNPSFVPGAMSSKGERMNFIDRIKNVADVMMGEYFFSKTFVAEIEVFRKKFGPHFKSYEELLADASYIFTNSNPYLDYPRSMLHKTVPIGGFAVDIDPKKNVLSKEWDDILKERNTTVLVSFGSVAKSIYMPNEYRNNLLKLFESMPQTTFIWKYEEEGSKMADHLNNVHLSTWLPQNALLADPRLTAFITHGGVGSATELAHLGKPAIIIPVFADQIRNAHMVAKHGGAIVLEKSDLGQPEKLRNALNAVFTDVSYSQNAKRLSEMLLNQPISAKQLLLRHSEFAARFGRLPNLDPYGRHLSFIQYFLIDIFIFFVSIVVVVAYVVVKLVRKFLSMRTKSKKD